MATQQGPIGVWLLDDVGDAKVTISLMSSPAVSREQLRAVAIAVAEALPEDGIEIPDQ